MTYWLSTPASHDRYLAIAYEWSGGEDFFLGVVWLLRPWRAFNITSRVKARHSRDGHAIWPGLAAQVEGLIVWDIEDMVRGRKR